MCKILIRKKFQDTTRFFPDAETRNSPFEHKIDNSLPQTVFFYVKSDFQTEWAANLQNYIMCNLSSPNTKRVAFLYTYLVAKKHMFSRQNSYLSFACKTLKGHQRTSESQHFENCMLGSTPLPSETSNTKPFLLNYSPSSLCMFFQKPTPKHDAR